MPRAKAEFDRLHPCDFYTPAELLDGDRMYSVYEIARLLQGLDPDEELDVGTEEILLDWAIPWVMRNADELVVAEPPSEEEPGYYGLRTEGDLAGNEAGTETADAEPGSEPSSAPGAGGGARSDDTGGDGNAPDSGGDDGER